MAINKGNKAPPEGNQSALWHVKEALRILDEEGLKDMHRARAYVKLEAVQFMLEQAPKPSTTEG